MQPREQGIYFFHKSFFYWRPSPYLGAASLPLAHSHLYSAVNDSCWLRIDLLTPPPADSLLYLHSLWSLRAHTKRLDSHWGFWAWREPASACSTGGIHVVLDVNTVWLQKVCNSFNNNYMPCGATKLPVLFFRVNPWNVWIQDVCDNVLV